MNTDASNVEDMNIHQTKERLSMSCIESSGERFSIFRNRSYTLFKNERDFRERSDSAAVSEFLSISTTNLLDTSLSVLGFRHFTRFPHLRRPLVVIVPFWGVWCASQHYGSPRTCLLHFWRAQRYFLTFRFGIHRVIRCNKSKHVRIPFAASRYQIRHRLWFCCDSFFTCIFLCSFRHHLRTNDRTEMANVTQTQKMIPLITCEFSLGQYVCELVFAVNVVNLNLGVPIDSIKQPIKSNSVGSGNMSHCKTSPLYDHLDHCFVVFQDVPHSLNFLSPALVYSDSYFRQEQYRSDPTSQARVYRPSLNLHPRKWFLILMSCAKLKFIFYTSSRLERTCGVRKYTMFHLK